MSSSGQTVRILDKAVGFIRARLANGMDNQSMPTAKLLLALLAITGVACGVIVHAIDAQHVQTLSGRVSSAHLTPTGGWTVTLCSASAANTHCDCVWFSPALVADAVANGVRLENVKPGRFARINAWRSQQPPPTNSDKPSGVTLTFWEATDASEGLQVYA